MEYLVGDLGKEIGLDQVLAGIDVIVHCDSASKGDVEAREILWTPQSH